MFSRHNGLRVGGSSGFQHDARERRPRRETLWTTMFVFVWLLAFLFFLQLFTVVLCTLERAGSPTVRQFNGAVSRLNTISAEHRTPKAKKVRIFGAQINWKQRSLEHHPVWNIYYTAFGLGLLDSLHRSRDQAGLAPNTLVHWFFVRQSTHHPYCWLLRTKPLIWRCKMM